MTNKIFTKQEVINLINAGHVMLLSGSDKALSNLPKGKWVAGTTPYFMDGTGKVDEENIFVDDFTDIAKNAKVIFQQVARIRRHLQQPLGRFCGLLQLQRLRQLRTVEDLCRRGQLRSALPQQGSCPLRGTPRKHHRTCRNYQPRHHRLQHTQGSVPQDFVLPERLHHRRQARQHRRIYGEIREATYGRQGLHPDDYLAKRRTHQPRPQGSGPRQRHHVVLLAGIRGRRVLPR